MGHANVPPCQSSLTQLTQEDEIHPVKRASEGILDIRGVLVYNLNARFGPRLVAVGPSVKAGAPFFRFQ
jgi:hypothetical protein